MPCATACATNRSCASASPATLHRLRIKAKRLRYALEALDGLGDAATRKLARKLAALQRRLGNQRDAANQRAWLADEMPAFVGDAEALVAVGVGVIAALIPAWRAYRTEVSRVLAHG